MVTANQTGRHDYPTTVETMDGARVTLMVNGKGVHKVFELSRLLEIEHWYESTVRQVFDSNGPTDELNCDLQEGEVRYDFDESVRQRMLVEFSRYPSLIDATTHLGSPSPEYMNNRDISVPAATSGTWHQLYYVERLFKANYFNWTELALACEYICELELAGMEVEPFNRKVHEIARIWDDFSF